jgi:hypothetical protein
VGKELGVVSNGASTNTDDCTVRVHRRALHTESLDRLEGLGLDGLVCERAFLRVGSHGIPSPCRVTERPNRESWSSKKERYHGKGALIE